MLIDSREKGKEGEREGKKRGCERETFISCHLYASQLRDEPTTQACVLTGNLTGDLLAYKGNAQATEPHWPGLIVSFDYYKG